MKGLVVTYLLAYGGAAVALFNPFVGVCIYWVFDIVRPQYIFAWAGTEGPFSFIIAAATIAGWLARGGGNWSLGRSRIIVALFLAYGVWILASASVAPNQAAAMGFVVPHLKRAIMFLIAVTTADSVRRAQQLAWVLTGSAGFVAFEMNLQYLQGFNHAQILGYGGVDNNCLAIAMVTFLGVAVCLGLYARPLWQKAAAFGAAALIGHTVLLTFSRGGVVGLIVAGFVALVVMPKRPLHLATIVGAALIALSFTGPEIRARFQSSFAEAGERDYSAQSRLDLWQDSVEVMQKYPLFGAGPDHFPLIAAEFGWPKGKQAHSLWLQLGAEIGIPGLVFLFSFYAATILKVWPLSRASAGSEASNWARHVAWMAICSLAGFMVTVQFVSISGLEAPLYVVVIALATLRAVPAGWERAPIVSTRAARTMNVGRSTGAVPLSSPPASHPPQGWSGWTRRLSRRAGTSAGYRRTSIG